MTDEQLNDMARADRAFLKAIATGRLSRDRTFWNCADHYRYMGTAASGLDLFKHIVTREYLA